MTYDVIGFWWGPGPPPAWWPKTGSKAEVSEIEEIKDRSVEYVVDPATGCWKWQRAISPYGYGHGGGGGGIAHREYYKRLVGPIPEGYDLHHHCGNRACVNPDHLTPMSHADHAARHSKNWGEANGSSKLTVDEVREIKRRLAQREVGAQLAREFGVSEVAVADIKRGKTWRWVDED